jgi:acetyltransferase
VAIIGASEDPVKLSSLPLKYMLDRKYPGKLFPVNPKRDTIMGLKAYPNVTAIPEDVDAVVVIVGAELVPSALRECAEKGVKAAAILAAGFAEIGGEGKKRQDEVEAIARESGMLILGPNTNGLLNLYENAGLGFSYAHEVAVPGRLALISQSGALISAIVPRAVQRGVGFSYFIGVGNQADLEIADYAAYILDDPNTDVIALYVEGFKTPEKFLAVADMALQKKKPLMVLKIGRSELSAKVAMGHSASLAGSAQVFDALCKQRGIIQVDDVGSGCCINLRWSQCPAGRPLHESLDQFP